MIELLARYEAGHHAPATRSRELAGGAGFASYGALSTLLRAAIDAAKREAPDLVKRYRAALDNFDPTPRHNTATALVENDPRLVLRRLSRESVGLAHDVDNLARFLLAAHEACPTLRGPWRLTVDAAAVLDRPSLRVLARIGALRGSIQADLRLEIARPAFAVFDPVDPVAAALDASRGAMVEAVARAWNIAITFGGAARVAEWPPSMTVRNAFRDQNYEGVTAATQGGGLDALLARTLMLVNINRVELALGGLASALTRSPREARATIHYLIGLILVKRRHALDEGKRHFAAGLVLNDPADPGQRLERGWLLNAVALADTLLALGQPRPVRDPALAGIIERQNAIMALANGADDDETLYLRYNILANTSLLLEAMGNFELACLFWQRAFAAAYAIDDSATGAGPLAFHYRQGMLALKAERANEAADQLHRALDSARCVRANLLESRVHYALGWLASSQGQHEAARRCWRGGQDAAIREADPPQQSLIRAALDSLDGTIPRPAPPPSKIGSNLAHIDLDPEPSVDLNRKIADGSIPVRE